MIRTLHAVCTVATCFVVFAGCALPFGTSPRAVEADAEDVSEDVSEDPSAPDADTGGAEDVRHVRPNGCGGYLELEFEGRVVSRGEACGDFGEGTLVCGSLNTVYCSGQVPLNACGGRGLLPVELGAACGPCEDGIWACDEAGGVACLGAREPNACGGCAMIEGRPGASCDAAGVSGVWVCSSRYTLSCAALTREANACGGVGSLQWAGAAANPGAPCDTDCGSDDGVLVCAEPDRLACAPTPRAVPQNACGGCGSLPGIPGEECGLCGPSRWACAGGNGDMVCVHRSVPDACGGCSGLSAIPGEACGAGLAWHCDGSALRCAPTPEDDPSDARNACGGTAELAGVPGAPCGACGRGIFVCGSLESVVCAGDAPGNACGGCEVDVGRVGDVCGACGTGAKTCEGTRLVCAGDQGSAATNACGGCGTLGASPGEVCGACMIWQCTHAGGLRCEADTGSAECGEPASCGDLECEAEGRACEQPDGEGDARCGACLPGYAEAYGVCRRVRQDACMSDENRAVLSDPDSDPEAVVIQCVLDNMQEQDPEARYGLAHACARDRTQLTSRCTGCFVARVECMIANCLTPPANCAANPDGANCRACMNANCREAFVACAGDIAL